jgi:hypothetical protein
MIKYVLYAIVNVSPLPFKRLSNAKKVPSSMGNSFGNKTRRLLPTRIPML